MSQREENLMSERFWVTLRITAIKRFVYGIISRLKEYTLNILK